MKLSPKLIQQIAEQLGDPEVDKVAIEFTTDYIVGEGTDYLIQLKVYKGPGQGAILHSVITTDKTLQETIEKF